ncbi:MAG: PadR family transcriptional regulator [Acidobacteriota bacterium]
MSTTAPPDPQALLPLTVPVYTTLLALNDAERHGYAIIMEIERRTGGDVRLRTGTLYTAVQRMIKQGLIEESDRRPDPELDDERRRYYRITEFGRQVAEAEARRLEQMVSLARDQRLLSSAGAGTADEG